MKSQQIRETFLSYFEKVSHTRVSSSSLVPHDATLLFTNSGMVQFKDVFLGTDKRPYSRATTAQRCVRAGGKHNDLDNVGYTARHHTFFEMLGNFSFGDYFKVEAITFAWKFLTEVLSIPKEKLWVTVFRDDDEAFEIWTKTIGFPASRISRCGEKDNFWSMGDTGPCGPCSEIFYDHGEAIAGGPPGSPDADGDRYIEIWNLVFMQFNRSSDGILTPLPKPSVDTGMGLERLSAVMQGVHDNYETDLFVPLLEKVASLVGRSDIQYSGFRVIADHSRAATFLVADGVVPSNEGRGYVLRRIIRRALRHGYQLGLSQFFAGLVPMVISMMKSAYPYLSEKAPFIETMIAKEEAQFSKTLSQGMRLFEEAISGMTDGLICGDIIFKLYDTYGFPVDLTADLAREKGLLMDIAGFEKAMETQRNLSKASSQFGVDYTAAMQQLPETPFLGYEAIASEASVMMIFKDNQLVDSIEAGEEGFILLSQTPFYAESGGQVGDEGKLIGTEGIFVVNDTQKKNHSHLHYGKVLEGRIQTGEKLSAVIDSKRRAAIANNHSATHLLHAALKKVLGHHIEQKGSLVDGDKLRLDFSHPSALTDKELNTIIEFVNHAISEGITRQIDIMPIEEAKKAGAVALFGEKYGETVRVLSFGEVSKELCGGTHVDNTAAIRLFVIVEEGGVAAGIRRITAVTGDKAFALLKQSHDTLKSVTQALSISADKTLEKIETLLNEKKALEKSLKKFEAEALQKQAKALWDEKSKNQPPRQATPATPPLEGNSFALIDAILPNTSMQNLRAFGDALKSVADKPYIFLLGGIEGEKGSVMILVHPDLSKTYSANELIKRVNGLIAGQGGGRPEMAQAGGNTNLKAAFEAVRASI